ncbi:glycine/D-amino acid oxidase-like deaminating enzyme [Polymorphobacter multimanifer]|uniref:Glycine/D-amino acid oxidase-like deaminating enzyme n=1 Tax=Polymorphobacter multimanifer TaxID=1070431 RepID=A0A841LEM3_9SPHN|nr:glycine/D-amino acid oxidase-like deaminating enzyme [Polymorphobacter multimanifer]
MTPRLPQRAETVVIGGGIVGTCIAGFLAEAGMAVTLLDSGHAAGSTSNAGSLHVQMQSRFMRLYPAQVPGLEAQLPLYPLAVRFWAELGARLGLDFEMKLTGGLMVAESEEQLAFLGHKAARERALGLDVEILGRSDVERMAPYLGPAIVGAELCRDEGKLNPLAANKALAGWTRGLGVDRRPGVRVTAVAADTDGFVVESDAGRMACRRLVIAAAWDSGRLAAPFGLAIPSVAEPLNIAITEPASPLIGHLVQHADRMITLKQLGSGQVVIGGGWPALPAAGNAAPGLELDSLIASATLGLHVVPALGQLRILRCWAGNNTVVDGRGVLGRVAGHPGLAVAIPGDAGYTLGPLAARMVADDILGRAPMVDIEQFRPERFNVALPAQAAGDGGGNGQ